MTSVVFGVVSNPVNASTIELAFPAPHTAEGPEGAEGPYRADAASVVIDASAAATEEPVKLIVDVSPVGNT